jgi:hypothetical protein
MFSFNQILGILRAFFKNFKFNALGSGKVQINIATLKAKIEPRNIPVPSP